jgi:hypothetical protein
MMSAPRIVAVLFFILGSMFASRGAADQNLVDFGKQDNLAGVVPQSARFEQRNNALHITFEPAAPQPAAATSENAVEKNPTAGRTLGHRSEILFKAPNGKWDLSAFEDVAVEVKNVGRNKARIGCRVDNPASDGSLNSMARSVEVLPGESKTLRVPLPRRFTKDFRTKLIGMRGVPWQISIQNFDLAKVTQLVIYVDRPTQESQVEIGNIAVCSTAEHALAAQEEQFFPLIDEFGQYKHKDWPGKVYSVDDLAARKQEEAADLAAHPGPADWDQYGGWKTGPQLKATGHFRTEKLNGKWWLVDPEGRLFWSVGMNTVNARDADTPITDRQHWFTYLPPNDGDYRQLYRHWGGASHDYYKNKEFDDFSFGGLNLVRKYGDDSTNKFFQLIPTRLRSWGLNTIGGFSDLRSNEWHKTPYVGLYCVYSRMIEGSEGFWRKFGDVFDPSFMAAAEQQAEQCAKEKADDPWCLGIFVDNELGWGDNVSLAVATLRSPADQPAKLAFIDDLKKKYGDIERLNEVWGTQHASWDALLQSTTSPDKQKAQADLGAFYTRCAERYFEICRNAFKKHSPNLLYLGCRFAFFNDRAQRAAAKYCDVVSFNRYKHSAADLMLPEGCDAPIIIGEFHFGALDRGMFHSGVCGVSSQDFRAKMYKKYMEGVLDNRQIVGAHWFQFVDEANTARSDGENYQAGFVDVCDTPYPELIQSAREVGDEIYQRRSKGE